MAPLKSSTDNMLNPKGSEKSNVSSITSSLKRNRLKTEQDNSGSGNDLLRYGINYFSHLITSKAKSKKRRK